VTYTAAEKISPRDRRLNSEQHKEREGKDELKRGTHNLMNKQQRNTDRKRGREFRRVSPGGKGDIGELIFGPPTKSRGSEKDWSASKGAFSFRTDESRNRRESSAKILQR
jgi:hypothetical protein